MFDGSLKHDIEVILDEHVDYFQVFPEPAEHGLEDGFDQQLMLLQLKYSLLKHKLNLEKFRYLQRRNLAETHHLLELILRVDCFDIEAVGCVALEEVEVVADDVAQNHSFLPEVALKGVHDSSGHGHPRIALEDVVHQQEHCQQLLRLLNFGNAFSEAAHVCVPLLDMECVEFPQCLLN